MNIIDVINPVFELFLTLILFLLLFLGWKTINSYWLKQEPQKRQTKFKKGIAEYQTPPRPYSKKFFGFLQLAQMTTHSRQEQLTRVFSNSIKEYLELKPLFGSEKFSNNVNLLINDPNTWFQHHYDNISILKESQKKKSTSDYFYEEYVKVLSELEELMDIQLLNKSE